MPESRELCAGNGMSLVSSLGFTVDYKESGLVRWKLPMHHLHVGCKRLLVLMLQLLVEPSQHQDLQLTLLGLHWDGTEAHIVSE